MRLAPVFLLVALCGCEELPPGEYPNAGEPEETQITADESTYEDTDPSALTEFRTTLDPHGTWVEDDVYGTVWVPNSAEVGVDFTPYATAGHWAYEDEDWIWVSDYEWGWAPFHYGRWVFIDGRGWGWIPGRRYAGAWVTWAYDGSGYLGWSVVPPAWYWHHGVAVGLAVRPGYRYVYVPRGEVFEHHLGGHVFWGGERAASISKNMRPYERAEPHVSGGHPFGQSAPHGPVPQSVGIDRSHVPTSNGHAGVMHAQQMSRPITAAPHGARAPSSHVVRSAPSRGGGGRGGGHGGHR